MLQGQWGNRNPRRRHQLWAGEVPGANGGHVAVSGRRIGRAGKDQDGHDPRRMRRRVIVPQIPAIGGSLIDVGAHWCPVVLEFEDEDGAADHEDHVGATAALSRQFILEHKAAVT